jgi:hypothetical protein
MGGVGFGRPLLCRPWSYAAPRDRKGFSVPYVYGSVHDWDLNDNGIYGQFYGNGDVDGVFVWPNLSVRRAPVSNRIEAETFVDKVVAYETFLYSGTGVLLSPGWPRSALIAWTDW